MFSLIAVFKPSLQLTMKKTAVTRKGFYSNLKCIKKLVISQNFHAINVADFFLCDLHVSILAENAQEKGARRTVARRMGNLTVRRSQSIPYPTIQDVILALI